MMVSVVIGLKPTDIEPSHTGLYHGSIYKADEFPQFSESAPRVPLPPFYSVVAVLVNGRKYINRQFVFSDSERVLYEQRYGH
jgi:hypothetical protein